MRHWPAALHPFQQPPSLLLHESLPWPSHRPLDLMSPGPYMQAHCFYALLHIKLWVTSGDDEQRLIISDRSDLADHLTAERLKGAADQALSLDSSQNTRQYNKKQEVWGLVLMPSCCWSVYVLMKKSFIAVGNDGSRDNMHPMAQDSQQN